MNKKKKAKKKEKKSRKAEKIAEMYHLNIGTWMQCMDSNKHMSVFYFIEKR